MTHANHLAFPAFDSKGECMGPDSTGLDKREHFAAMILQGLVSKYTMNKTEDQTTISQMAVELADEFIKQLNK